MFLQPNKTPLTDKASHIRLMGFDVDGVLTDGSLHFSETGEYLKTFSSQDGHGLKMLQEGGIMVALITGRQSKMLALRAANLGITHLYQGVKDKRQVMRDLRTRLGLTARECGYIGDDIVDLPILTDCGFSASVADGHPFVHQHVDYITGRHGGRGAVRELCDFLLDSQNKLEALHQAYLRGEKLA